MLGIIFLVEISPQVTTIICHHMKIILLKKRKRKKIQKYGRSRPKLICYQKRRILKTDQMEVYYINKIISYE